MGERSVRPVTDFATFELNVCICSEYAMKSIFLIFWSLKRVCFIRSK